MHTDASIGWAWLEPATDVEALLERTAQNDRSAFATLYDRIAPAAYGVALRVAVDPCLAEDVVQEALLIVWSTAARFDRSRGTGRGWIMSIAHRRAVDAVRSEQAARRRVERAAEASTERPFDHVAEAVTDKLDRQELSTRVGAALSTLTNLQRSAIEMAYFGGLTQPEVARTLGIPLGTLKTRVRDGMLRLTAELKEQGQWAAN